jgi:hypothetical protein
VLRQLTFYPFFATISIMENWKPVPRFEDFYEISDLGRLKRILASSGTYVGKIVKPNPRRGYHGFLISAEGKTHTISAHRTVWEAFNGPIPIRMHINHINGLKRDNRLCNLELVTPSANALHAINVLGHVQNPPPRMKGIENPRAKLTEETVREIRRLYASGLSQQSLSDQFGIHQTNISKLLRGKSWSSVGP